MEAAIDDDLFRCLLVDKALTELDPSVPNLPLRAEPQTLSLKIPNRSFHHKHRVKLAKGTYGGGTTGLSVRKGRLTRQSISGLGEHAEALLGLSPQAAGSKFPGEETGHSLSPHSCGPQCWRHSKNAELRTTGAPPQSYNVLRTRYSVQRQSLCSLITLSRIDSLVHLSMNRALLCGRLQSAPVPSRPLS